MSTQSHSPVSLPSFSKPLLSTGSPSDPSPCTSTHGPYDDLKIARGRRKKRETVSRVPEYTRAQKKQKERENVRARDESYRNAMTISILPDNVLLEIFSFCRENYDRFPPLVWKWHLLAHVCRRWRQIILASPRRLGLEILCIDGTPVRKNLGIWPAIPIVVRYGRFSSISPDDEDDAIAALENSNRVCYVKLYVTGSQLGRIATVMQEPFPVLTHLSISTKDRNVPVIPSKFLGGSAPCLQEIDLDGVPFPGLPKLLLSANNLVKLQLDKIPPTGYIPPEVMVARLAAFPRLRTFHIRFQLATPRPDRMHLPPVTRIVLPALTHFYFFGACEYSEDFMARIDTPQLVWLQTFYLNQVVDFEVPQLSGLIIRSDNLVQTLSKHCDVMFHHNVVAFYIGGAGGGVSVGVVCEGMDWQISHMTHVLDWIYPILTNMVHFVIGFRRPKSEPEVMDDIEWLQLLRPFPSVRTLFVSRKIAEHVSRVLEDTAGVMATGVLPSLDLLCLEDQPASSIDKFIVVRRDSGRPVTVANANTKREFERRLQSYPRR